MTAIQERLQTTEFTQSDVNRFGDILAELKKQNEIMRNPNITREICAELMKRRNFWEMSLMPDDCSGLIMTVGGGWLRPNGKGKGYTLEQLDQHATWKASEMGFEYTPVFQEEIPEHERLAKVLPVLPPLPNSQLIAQNNQ